MAGCPADRSAQRHDPCRCARQQPLLCPLCPTSSASRFTSGDAAVGLDMASTEYVHWNGRGGVPASYNLGGGGVVTDVTVTGGRAGIRTAASQVRRFFGGLNRETQACARNLQTPCAPSQFTLTDITVSGSEVCVQMWQLTWAISWLRLRASDCGIGALVQVWGLVCHDLEDRSTLLRHFTPLLRTPPVPQRSSIRHSHASPVALRFTRMARLRCTCRCAPIHSRAVRGDEPRLPPLSMRGSEPRNRCLHILGR